MARIPGVPQLVVPGEGLEIDPWGLVIRQLAVFAASGYPQGFVLRLTEKDRADTLSDRFKGLAD